MNSQCVSTPVSLRMMAWAAARAPQVGSCGPACHGLGPIGTASGEVQVTPRGGGTPWEELSPPPFQVNRSGRALSWSLHPEGPGRHGDGVSAAVEAGAAVGLHFLTFSHPVSPQPSVPCSSCCVPSPTVSTSPVPASPSGSLGLNPVTRPAQDGLPKEGVCPFLLADQRAGRKGEGETQRHRDRARDTETGPETPIYKDREGETWRDTGRHRDVETGP